MSISIQTQSLPPPHQLFKKVFGVHVYNDTFKYLPQPWKVKVKNQEDSFTVCTNKTYYTYASWICPCFTSLERGSRAGHEMHFVYKHISYLFYMHLHTFTYLLLFLIISKLISHSNILAWVPLGTKLAKWISCENHFSIVHWLKGTLGGKCFI